MDSFRLDRHFTLWEENNKLIKRVVSLTVMLSLAIVVKVLVPFVDNSEDKRPIRQNIDSLATEKAHVNEKLAVIQRTEKTMEEVNRFIASQPWQREKEALIERYQGMREGHSRESYQSKADDTIRNIGAMLRENIADPLKRGTAVADEQAPHLARLNEKVDSLDTFIEQWQNRYLGARWYATIDTKELTMSDLSQELNQHLDRFSGFLSQELTVVQRSKQVVDQKLQSVSTQIDTERTKLDEIEERLQSLLPQWIRGFIDTNQMIQLLPILLLAMAGYGLMVGINLTQHYRSYAAGKHLEEDVTTEPAMSSTWTLIPRGSLGTAQTLMAYSFFFLATWILLEKSMSLLLDWIAIDDSHAWIASPGPWRGFLWLSRLVFVGLMVFVCTMPRRRLMAARH